ncbi:hypothetical protein MGN70_012627 [Eutypa lata]|nr:hypothetical protein MGN70_012627 [Eutypa lata]
MRPTATCLSKGFWGRSLDEFKRLSNIAFKLEGVKGPSGPFVLHDFSSPDSVDDCKVMSDADIGGYSTASLDWVPPSSSSPSSSSSSPSPSPSPTTSEPAHARFHGAISTALPPNRPDVQRSGYAGFRTRDRPPTVFGRSLWDIDMYTYLALRVRWTDERSYLINVQTESVEPTDLHQHRLFARRPGEWETVLVRWNDFVRTNHGFVVEPQTEMLRRRVRSIGVGLTDRVPGPFELCIARVWATNDASEGYSHYHHHNQYEQPPQSPEDNASPAAVKEGQLRNKQGKNISWNE